METTDQLITDIDRHFAEACAERGIAVPERLNEKAENQPPVKSAGAYTEYGVEDFVASHYDGFVDTWFSMK